MLFTGGRLSWRGWSRLLSRVLSERLTCVRSGVDVREWRGELRRWFLDLPGDLDDTQVCSGCFLIGFSVASSFLGDEEIDVRTSLRDLRVTLGLLWSKVDSSFQPFKILATTIRRVRTLDSELSWEA